MISCIPLLVQEEDFDLAIRQSTKYSSLVVLVYLFVHPEHRRRGIGRQLINWGKWISNLITDSGTPIFDLLFLIAIHPEIFRSTHCP